MTARISHLLHCISTHYNNSIIQQLIISSVQSTFGIAYYCSKRAQNTETMNNYIFIILLLIGNLSIAQQTKWTGSRPDGHAPINVMGDHTHGKGELMFSYRYMYMTMEELKSGSDDASFAEALNTYMVTPTRMPMQMHMIGAMYAPSDKITLMIMGNYLDSSMDHITRMGQSFSTTSRGFGDTKISALYNFFDKNKQKIHAQIGLSIPTGSIDKQDVTPASRNAFANGMRNSPETILPYPMQLGSGTFDGEFAITYLKQWSRTSFGAQARTTVRFGENDNEYTLGNRYQIDTWFAINATNIMSFSARLRGVQIDEIEGANPMLNPRMVITADTNNSGGTLLESGFGVNFYTPSGSLKNLRMGIEFGYPLYQDLNGIQMKNKESFTVGLQYAL